MYEHADKTSENTSQPTTSESAAKKDSQNEVFGEFSVQLRANEFTDNSPKAKTAAQLRLAADKFSSQRHLPIQKKENDTGLPDSLKAGIESISGFSMDDVRVHRNSQKPAQLQAHAYAQGTDIHLAPGQEKHMPHEAWHVVQQKQGRVKPTKQLKSTVNINDEVTLEKEADVMGAKANRVGANPQNSSNTTKVSEVNSTVNQRMFDKNTPVQLISLVALGGKRYKNIDPNRAEKGEKDFYDTSDPSDLKIVQQHIFQTQILREEEERNSDEQDDFGGGLMMQEQLLMTDSQSEVQQNNIPQATAKLGGSDYTKAGKNGMIASSKVIDITATWTPGPVPPAGHSPNALVGFVQNIFHSSDTADYFLDDGSYVETYLKEHNGQVIDSDDDSPWYDPPRTYSDLDKSAERKALFGPRDPKKKSPIGVSMADKPQAVFPYVSKHGGKLYRYGGETTFIAYLMIIEPDGSKATVLEHFEWKYEFAYTRTGIGKDFVRIYADTEITSQGKGPASKKPKFIPSGPHGNVFFESLPVHWTKHTEMTLDDPDRFPSLL